MGGVDFHLALYSPISSDSFDSVYDSSLRIYFVLPTALFRVSKSNFVVHHGGASLSPTTSQDILGLTFISSPFYFVSFLHSICSSIYSHSSRLDLSVRSLSFIALYSGSFSFHSPKFSLNLFPQCDLYFPWLLQYQPI